MYHSSHINLSLSFISLIDITHSFVSFISPIHPRIHLHMYQSPVCSVCSVHQLLACPCRVKRNVCLCHILLQYYSCILYYAIGHLAPCLQWYWHRQCWIDSIGLMFRKAKSFQYKQWIYKSQNGCKESPWRTRRLWKFAWLQQNYNWVTQRQIYLFLIFIYLMYSWCLSLVT